MQQEHINISQDKSVLMAAERERQFIGDILADENSDYGQESPREEEKKNISSKDADQSKPSEIISPSKSKKSDNRLDENSSQDFKELVNKNESEEKNQFEISSGSNASTGFMADLIDSD